MTQSDRRDSRGITLLELVIATAILSIGVLSLIGAFTQINLAVQGSKSKSLATNLVQEKIEALKNISYYRLLVTTSPLTETKVAPSFQYDTGYYPPEKNLNVGGVIFDRRVYIHKMAEDAGGTLIHKDWSDGDTGLKEIQVHVIWQQGNEWKCVRASNLRDDPDRSGTDASFSGNVKDTLSANLEDVNVDIIQNSAWNTLTDANGNYSFQVTAGTYTLRATKSGYFTAFSGQKTVLEGGIETVDFTLLKMASGTITGTAYIRDHLVISQVAGSSVTDSGFEQEWVEIFNPTTYTWTVDGAIGLKFQRRSVHDTGKRTIQINYITNSIQSEGFYLFANTDTINAGGVTVTADALWDASNPVADFPHFSWPGDPNIIPVFEDGGDEGGGAIELYRISGAILDQFGWTGGGSGQMPPFYETTPLGGETRGLENKEQYVRYSSEGGHSSTLGPAYDSGVNNTDWARRDPISIPPRNSATVQPVVSGTPASDAIVFANDNLAPAVTAKDDGSFTLLSVATGTWTLTVSSGLLTSDTTGVAVADSATTDAGTIVLSSVSETGYVTGTVTDINGFGIDAILVIGGGGCNTNTDPDGNYRLAAPPGIQQIAANPNNSEPNYVSSAQDDVTVTLGGIVQDIDFILAKGASLKGFSSSNGVDAYPGLVAIAKLDGMEQGSAVAGAGGYFTITNLSTGSYTVEAVPDSGESAAPSSYTRTIAVADAGNILFIGTFTVSGAMGNISGTLKENLSAINTGVLIVVTSATISGSPPVPPAIDNSLRSGSVKYFSASSGADGSYSVPVIGGYDYNIYAWYTNINGTTVCKSSATVPVKAGEDTPVDINWP